MVPQANALYQQACSAEYREDYKTAVSKLLEALNLSANDVMIYTKLAGVYSEMGEYDKALETYAKVAELKPADGYIYISVGSIYENQGKYLEALKAYNKVMEMCPEYLYNYLKQQGRGAEANKLAEHIKDPDVQSSLFGGSVNIYNQPYTSNSATGTPDSRAFIHGTEDPLYQLLMNPYKEEGTGFLGLVKTLKPEYTMIGKNLEERYAQYLNDAIIYKDNSVYVPHPDDNIVLTKDDVSTPVLSNSFESNLFNLLEELLSKKSSGASVVSVQSVKPQIDFSLLRI